jgi:alcohol dehydrogenase class IV
MNFQFNLPTQIHLGTESLDELEREIREKCYARVAFIYDHNLGKHPLIKQIRENLISFTTLVEGVVEVAEPTYEFLESFRVNFSDDKIEAVIGIGGGSTLDTAKAMAVLVHNKKSSLEYRGFDLMDGPVLPVYAIPTTAGTGSEITPNASFVDSLSKKKLGINGQLMRPVGAYLHPGFITTCPEGPAASAGLDALVHAIEAFSSKKTNPVAGMYAKEAVHLVSGNLVEAIKTRDEKTCFDLFLGSHMAGIALMHSTAGPAAALSYPLGVHCGVAHGLAGGIFLPHIMRFNIERGYYGYKDLFPGTHGLDEKEGSLKAVDYVFDIIKSLKVPLYLNEVGFKPELLEIFLADLQELRGAIDQNPIDMKEQDLKNLIHSLTCA